MFIWYICSFLSKHKCGSATMYTITNVQTILNKSMFILLPINIWNLFQFHEFSVCWQNGAHRCSGDAMSIHKYVYVCVCVSVWGRAFLCILPYFHASCDSKMCILRHRVYVFGCVNTKYKYMNPNSEQPRERKIAN